MDSFALIKRSYDLIFMGGSRAEFEATFSRNILFVDGQWGMRIEGVDAFYERFSLPKHPPKRTQDVFVCHRYFGNDVAAAVPWTWLAAGRLARVFDLPEDSGSFTVEGVGLFEFEGDKLALHRDIYDSAPLLRHWGAAIPHRTA